MIDKVLVLTLKRCSDRQRTWLGASQMRGIPLDMISFVQGYDGKDYPDMDSIAIAAAEDGFDFVEEYALGTVTEYVQQTTGSVSQIWNFARILRHISERDETCLVLTDDKMLTVSFNILNVIVKELLETEDEEFFALQLWQRGDLNELDFQSKDRFEQAKISEQVFGGLFFQTIPSYKDFFLKKGVIGYEESMVLSPAGANWILNCLQNADDFYIFYDHFIHKRLTIDAAFLSGNGKGVYTPREAGYIFVSEIMPMGTTTDWAPPGTHHYEEANHAYELNWENVR